MQFHLFSSTCSLHFSQSSSFPISHNNSRIVAAKLSKQKPQDSPPQNAKSSTSVCPLLKFFSTPDPSQERNNFLEVATSSLSTLARCISVYNLGSVLPGNSEAPRSSAATTLWLLHGPTLNERCCQGCQPSWDVWLSIVRVKSPSIKKKACPFCRRVREAMTELDLSVEVYPCPKGSRRHREIVKQLGGKEQYPFLLDPNSEVSMYESGDIVKYLFEKYGQGRSPSVGLLESTLFTGWVPTILRAGRGMSLWEKSRKEPPPKKLELFSYETNPISYDNLAAYAHLLRNCYARIVREALCELELPYILHNVGNGSLRSKLLLQMSGSKEVPYLIDPNNDIRLGDYTEILTYLFQTYSTAS